eukprot:c18636_g1_i2 orf=37-702(+)
MVEGAMEKRSFMILYNVAKRHNLGTLARSATAFGVSELIIVGRKDFNSFGSHGASRHLQLRHFFTLSQARLYLKGEKDCDICGVEIVDGAKAIHERPFFRSTAFLLGNEGTGLSIKEMAICDFFVYISQYGCGTASLNVAVAASIVLHHFAVWAGFSERQRDGQKFVVSEHPLRKGLRNTCMETPEAIAGMRQLKKMVNAHDWLDSDLTYGKVECCECGIA